MANVLEDAYPFERHVDVAAYQRQRDTLRQGIAMFELELQDAKLDEVDAGGFLRAGEGHRRDGISRCEPSGVSPLRSQKRRCRPSVEQAMLLDLISP